MRFFSFLYNEISFVRCVKCLLRMSIVLLNNEPIRSVSSLLTRLLWVRLSQLFRVDSWSSTTCSFATSMRCVRRDAFLLSKDCQSLLIFEWAKPCRLLMVSESVQIGLCFLPSILLEVFSIHAFDWCASRRYLRVYYHPRRRRGADTMGDSDDGRDKYLVALINI